MADDRDELSATQRVLNAALALNEAVYELVSLAQVPQILETHLLEACMAAEPKTVAFASALDKVAEAISHLHHAGGSPADTAVLALAAEDWTHGVLIDLDKHTGVLARNWKGPISIGRSTRPLLGRPVWTCNLHVDGESMVSGRGPTIQVAVDGALEKAR